MDILEMHQLLQDLLAEPNSFERPAAMQDWKGQDSLQDLLKSVF